MPSRRDSLLVGLLLLGSVAATAPLAGTADARSTGCIPRIDQVDRGEAVGDVLTVELRHCFESSVTITGPDYNATVRLESRDYSGGVRVRLDTDASGTAALSASPERIPDDELAVEATVNGTLEPGRYEITLRDGHGRVAERTTVTLSEPTAKGVELWRAPRGAAGELDDLAAVRVSRERSDDVDDEWPGDSPDQPTLDVATNETLVVALEASGLESAMAADDGPSLAGFREALAASSLRFEFVQTEVTSSPQRALIRPDLLNSSATHLVPDAANGTYYLVVDTRDLTGEWGGHGGPVHVGQRPGFGFRASLYTEAANDSAAPSDAEGADYLVVEPAASPTRTGVDDRVAVAPSQDATVSARTTLAPGTPVTLVLERGETLARAETTVTRNGTVVAALPLDDVEPGTATLRVEAHGRTLSTTPAVVSTPDATVTLPDQTPEDGRVRTRNLSTNRMAVLALYAGAGTDGEPLATRSVSPDASWDITISLGTVSENPPSNVTVALYADEDADTELDAGELRLATDHARLSPSPLAGTPTRTATSTVSPTSTQGQTVTWTEVSPSGTTTRTTTQTTTPGFTVVGTLLALFLVGFLGHRR